MIDVTSQTMDLIEASATVGAVVFLVMVMLNGLARIVESKLWE